MAIKTIHVPSNPSTSPINIAPLAAGKYKIPYQKRVSKSTKAGLLFPVSRISRYLKMGNYAARVSESAAITLTSVIQYLIEELLMLAGEAAIGTKKRRITPRHVLLAIKGDDEFRKLLENTTIASAGIVAQIHEELLPSKKRKQTSSQKRENLS